MMGRRRELESLRVALHELSSDGCVAAVTGEAGIGKSRLVDSLLATAAADGAAVLAARAFPAEGSIAYAPIVELLRTAFAAPGAARRLAGLAPATLAEVERLVPLPTGMRVAAAAVGPADSPAARVRLLEAIATVLAAIVHGPVPGIVAVEDLHWADDASREALLYLARRLEGRSILLLFTWRPADLEGGAEVFADARAGPARRGIGAVGAVGRRGGRGARRRGRRGGAAGVGRGGPRRGVRGAPVVRGRSPDGRSGRRRPRATAWRPRAPAGAPRERLRDGGAGPGGGRGHRPLLRLRDGSGGERALRRGDRHVPRGARPARDRPRAGERS